MSHSVFIKSMVCNRCIFAVKQIFKELKLTPIEVTLGEVLLDHEPTSIQISELKKKLSKIGFDVIEDKRVRIVVNIKSLLLELLEDKNFDLKMKVSAYLSEKLHYEYHYLSNLFSEIEGTTIEKYFIQLKVEKIKEFIDYGETTFSEISYKFGYSSPAHLANQFKQVTGMTPTEYKSLNSNHRKPLDEL